MGSKHRLGAAEVGVGGDHESLLPLSQLEKRPLQLPQTSVESIDRPAAEEPQVGGHLIVAAAGGVQLAAGIANPLSEHRLDVEMDVFASCGERKAALSDLAANLGQRRHDLLSLVGGDDAAGGKHRGMGCGAGDVVLGEATVVGNALGERLHPLIGGYGKHAAPRLGRSWAVVHHLPHSLDIDRFPPQFPSL